MERQITALILMVAVLIVMPFQAYAASATETVETGVNKVLKILGDPAFKAKPKDVKIAEIGNIIGEVFDTEKELKKGRAEVQSNIVLSDGRKVPIFYRVSNKSGQWKVYDLIIEGVSLVKNYRTQFREIIAKDSPEKLLQILRNKVNKG